MMMELIIIICVLTPCRHECMSGKLQRFLTGFLLEIGIGQ